MKVLCALRLSWRLPRPAVLASARGAASVVLVHRRLLRRIEVCALLVFSSAAFVGFGQVSLARLRADVGGGATSHHRQDTERKDQKAQVSHMP